MTPQQKESLLEALRVIRDLSTEAAEKAHQKGNELVIKAKPQLIRLVSFGRKFVILLHRRITTMERKSKFSLLTSFLLGSTILVSFSLFPDRASTAASPHSTTPQKSKEMSIRDARVEHQISQKSIILEEQKAAAAEKARLAEIAALQAQELARLAQLRSSHSESDQYHRHPVELGYRTSNYVPESDGFAASNYERRRYQQHLSRTLSARGVR